VSDVFSNVSIELTVDLSRNLDKELASNTLDLAIQTAPFSVQTTGEIALGAYPFAWVAAPDIAAKPIDLYAQPILTHARGTVAYSELRDRLGDRANIVPSNALMSSLHMVLDGMGIAVLPQIMAQEHIASGALVALPMDWRPTPLQFSARFQSDKASGTVQAAAQIAAEVATDHILHSAV
jgi:DNA-binding transcriptional LysR family regulator